MLFPIFYNGEAKKSLKLHKTKYAERHPRLFETSNLQNFFPGDISKCLNFLSMISENHKTIFELQFRIYCNTFTKEFRFVILKSDHIGNFLTLNSLHLEFFKSPVPVSQYFSNMVIFKISIFKKRLLKTYVLQTYICLAKQNFLI